ncbi:hypothetical protein LP417_08290 [Polaromonas sp. P1-6]|nr:hypothetical protein LP417_08290 [Polaromonas sp. P1-6]
MDTLNTTDDRQAAPPAKPARRWLKTVALAGGAILSLGVLATSALWWWAGTDGSLATALRWVAQSQPLSAERATGSLRSGGHVGQLIWLKDGLSVQARDVSLAWQPWSLLQGTLKLDRLAAASVEVNDQRIPSPTASSGPPSALVLPLRVTLDAFSVDQLRWMGPTAFTTFGASGISGRYEFNDLHQLDLASAQVASGRYSGRAVLTSRGPLMLEASLSGTLQAAIPNSKTTLPLSFQATARGPLTELLVDAALQMNAKPAADRKQTQTPTQPQASATARITPWAAQPLPQADATYRDLDIAALWPEAPQTLLTGSASVRPLDSTPAAPASAGWLLDVQLANRLPGPWDKTRLPLEHLEAKGEWRNGVGIVRTLKAQLGGGELLASGEWSRAPSSPPSKPGTSTAASAQAWNLQATLQNVNPAMLHTQLAALPLDGKATARSQGAAVGFEASVQAKGNAGNKPASGQNNPLGQLRLRDASATGSWNAQQAGGTLVLSALRVRTDEAELNGQLEAQPTARGGKGNLVLTGPGLDAKLQGELRQSSGRGDFSLRGRDAAQALRWLQKLPGMPAAVQTASASGSAELKASWQGGWRDPALQAQLEIPALDWRAAAPPKPATTPAAANPGVLKFRAVQATLSGRLSQAQLSLQGRLEADQRRYALQLAAEGGRVTSAQRSAERVGLASPAQATQRGGGRSRIGQRGLATRHARQRAAQVDTDTRWRRLRKRRRRGPAERARRCRQHGLSARNASHTHLATRAGKPASSSPPANSPACPWPGLNCWPARKWPAPVSQVTWCLMVNGTPRSATPCA